MSERPEILNIDFDDTICRTPPGAPWGMSEKVGIPFPYARDAIRRLKDEGYYVIIWTARYLQRDLDDVRAFLKKHDIPYDKINEPCDALEYKSWPKVFCDTQIDDNSLLNVDWRFIPYYVYLRNAMKGNCQLRAFLPLVSGEMAEYFYYRTVGHVKRVMSYCEKFMLHEVAFGSVDIIDAVKAQDELRDRALKHDSDKFHEGLVVQYILLTDKMRREFGRSSWNPVPDCGKPTEEAIVLQSLKRTLTDAVDWHREFNKHHPDYWLAHGSLKDMDAVSMVEMCADWCAMSEENHNDPTEFFVSRVEREYPWTQEQAIKIKRILAAMWQVV